MTKHTTPFLMVDYDLLGITSVEVNGETHEVKLHHKIVYSYLLSLSGTFKQVTPSLTGIGDRLGLGTDQTVRRHIKDLVSFGWVQVVSEGRKGMTNIYIVLPYHQKPPVTVSDEVPAPEPVKTVETHEDTPAITPQRIRTSDAVKHLFENLSQRREDESFYSWSSRVLQRIGIDHSMGIEQLFQETHPYEYTQIEQSTIPF
ncbi:helix-turn-helix domain-containing protein [Cronobacter malonaticus]|uniref:helix-turn-helix domain-containing protein n=1 Tax=Enterobacter cloacae complex TaxID=354276 RepID=UPI000B14C27D|nr:MULTISPECIES: helix-turn-helix domain-containing protein [Enterobacter cloacae complex]MBG0714388.1 helix-turn-helix domain-containing protein [Enterobacter hormaechei]MCF0045547.1 helix-turn-helix domain-containing protein [Enterobacter hormaechei]MDX6938268.1 helix-turn-helix domain-containing protein [Enterobacter kobei]HAS1356893.1 helix-turn-helix domain-containing protein [Enterobacter hormaechei]HAS1424515.1 helix-turn-helix domain-containing protein [Enterobacter hormaechei]